MRKRATPLRRAAAPPLFLLLTGLIFSLLAPAADAVTLTVTSATVSETGNRARVCVELESEGAPVAGTQNDLIWDGTCATLLANTCVVNPDHGKQLSSAFPPGPDFVFRAIVLSLGDVDPIPDGELYCCDFQVDVTRSGGCCPLELTRVGASDPSGQALSANAGPDGLLCLESNTTSGCQLVPDAGTESQLTVLVVIALSAGMIRWLRRPPRPALKGH